MASIPTFPNLSSSATMEQVIEHVAILQKTLTYAMSALNSTNITEVGGWIANDTDLAASNGSVGFSSNVTALNDIRIWAGDSASGSAPFRVYEDGTMYATKANISGNITMTGGSIVWGPVNKPSYAPGEVGAIPVGDQTAVYNALTNYGAKRGLFLDTSSGELYMNADYINAGTIKAANITTEIAQVNSTLSIGNKSIQGNIDFYAEGANLARIYGWRYHGIAGTQVNFKADGYYFHAGEMYFQSGMIVDFTGVDVRGFNTTAKYG